MLSEKGIRLGRLLIECGYVAQRAWINRSAITAQAEGRATETMDFFTDLDARLDERLISRIQAELGVSRFLTEEGKENPERNLTGGLRAVIDPLDGSSNFASYRPDFGISVAIEEKGEVLLAGIITPVRGELLLAEKGNGTFFLSFYGKKENEIHLRENLIQVNTSFFSLPQRKTVDNPLKNSRIYVHTGRRRNFELDPRDNWNTIYSKLANPVCYLSCAVALLEVALGKIEGAVIGFQNYWDFAAGRLIVAEAEGSFEVWDLNCRHRLADIEMSLAYAAGKEMEEWQSHIIAAGNEETLAAIREYFVI